METDIQASAQFDPGKLLEEAFKSSPTLKLSMDVLKHEKFNSLVFLEQHLLRCPHHDMPAKLTHACVDCKSGQIEALETTAPCGCKYRHEITTEVL